MVLRARRISLVLVVLTMMMKCPDRALAFECAAGETLQVGLAVHRLCIITVAAFRPTCQTLMANSCLGSADCEQHQCQCPFLCHYNASV